jgi:exo-beta-1,3-glucanase (GH17 family)
VDRSFSTWTILLMFNDSLEMNRTALGRRQCLRLAATLLLPAGLARLRGQAGRVFHGLNFSPYMDGQSPGKPISEEQIRARMKIVAPYTEWIRTYGVGGGLERAGAVAHELGLKAAIGVWLGRNQAANERQLAAGIACARSGDADMLVIGSETLLRGDLKVEQLCGYLQEARRSIPAKIPITTGDGYAQTQGNPDLVENVDLVFYNDYPYWGGVEVKNAIDKLDRHYSELVEQADGKRVWISEHGWPTSGETVGAAEATPENAAVYLETFLKWSREKQVRAFLFEAFDERWKAAQEGERGSHWGVWGSDGRSKPAYGRIVGGDDKSGRAAGELHPDGR